MTKGRQGSGPATRRAILESAAKNFLEKGYGGTSMGDIAKDVKFTPAAIYNHFKSKNDILFTILEDIGWRLIAMCKEAVAEVDEKNPRLQLEAFIRAHIAYEIQYSDIMPLIDYHSFRTTRRSAALTGKQQQIVINAQRELVALLQDILKRGEKSGDFKIRSLTTTTYMLLSPIEHVIYWFERGKGSLSQKEVTQDIIDFILRGISKT